MPPAEFTFEVQQEKSGAIVIAAPSVQGDSVGQAKPSPDVPAQIDRQYWHAADLRR